MSVVVPRQISGQSRRTLCVQHLIAFEAIRKPRAVHDTFSVFALHSFVSQAVKQEDEETLDTVQHREHIGEGDRFGRQVEQSERPREAEKEHQHCGASDPDPKEKPS